MQLSFLKRLTRLTLGMILFFVISIASLWATSWALEPRPAGEAIAPDPARFEDAIIQVYGADVWGIRGKFAIHTWVATKARGAAEYTIYQVIGWRLRRTGSALSISQGDPAQPWFGSPPILLHEIHGEAAEQLIAPVEAAARSYPYDREYRMWPGPNSNSFVAWIGLEVPQLGLELPVKALGQAWMKGTHADLVAARQ